MHHSNVTIFETSATGLCGTTGKLRIIYRTVGKPMEKHLIKQNQTKSLACIIHLGLSGLETTNFGELADLGSFVSLAFTKPDGTVKATLQPTVQSVLRDTQNKIEVLEIVFQHLDLYTPKFSQISSNSDLRSSWIFCRMPTMPGTGAVRKTAFHPDRVPWWSEIFILTYCGCEIRITSW